MNQEVKQKWIAALKAHDETNPGPVFYTHLKAGKLISPDGILCDIYMKEHGIEWGISGGVETLCLGRNCAMPAEVMKWAGLDRVDPILPSYTPPLGYTISTLNLLAYRAKSYTQIAEAIEKDL